MVISIVLVLVGSLTILTLPVAQFPSIAPPEIQILATYIGADAQTLEQAVATPIEQQMSGVDNMNYMYSLNATGNSTTSLIVDFDAKTDPNTDYILAQSRETLAASQLPVDVTNYGVTVRKSVTAPLMLIAVYSPHGTYDANFLANYAYINLADPHSAFAGHRQRAGIRRRPIRDAIVGKARHSWPSSASPSRKSSAPFKRKTPLTQPGRRVASRRPKARNLPTRFSRKAVLCRRRNSDRSSCARRPTAGPSGSAMSLESSLGSQDYSVAGRFNGKPSADHCHLPTAGLERGRCSRRRQQAHGADEAALPGRHGLSSSRWIRRARSPKA